MRHPEAYGLAPTRWTLKLILKVCNWLKLKSLPGMYQLLKRLKIHRKRGRGHLHSPDNAYVEKLRHIWGLIRIVRPDVADSVLLFADEMGFRRQPSLSYDYLQAGQQQPLAELGHRSNAEWRIAAALNAWTGQVTYASRAHFSVKLLVDFFVQLVATYPDAPQIYLVVDNWPVHFHPDVLAALQPQSLPFPLHNPSNWPTQPAPKARRLNLPIQLVQLPTYSPWANPIEKLWLLLRKEVLHLHRFEDHWSDLKLRVSQELDFYAHPSPDLLRFVGLRNPLRLYRALFGT